MPNALSQLEQEYKDVEKKLSQLMSDRDDLDIEIEALDESVETLRLELLAARKKAKKPRVIRR